MIVKAIKTERLSPKSRSLIELLDIYLTKLTESNILVITSKVVSLCEGRVVSVQDHDKEQLIEQEADLYLPRRFSKYNFEFTITKNTLIMSAGIDESNSGGYYVLWPKDPQKTANDIRAYLKKRFGLKKVGVVITDSTCTPLRWGTLGVPIAYSGFRSQNNYIGKKDLFGRPFKVSKSNVAGGIAAAATLAMGEGAEQTPLAIVSEVPFVTFQDHDPTREELEHFFVPYYKDDLFAPFLTNVQWQKGHGGKNFLK